MEVSFTYLLEDIASYQTDWNTYRKSVKGKIRSRRRFAHLLYYTALVIVPLVVFVSIGLLTPSFNWAFFGMVAAAIVWRYLLDKLWRYFDNRRILRGPNLQGRQTVKISADGLSGTTEQGVYTRYWANYVDIALATHNILFVHSNGAMTPIPLRAFPNTESAEAFFQEAIHYWKSSSWPPSPQLT